MCKIIAFTDLKKLNLKKHINDIGNTLLKSEKDGFGYAAKGKQGVYGEKTICKQFRSRIGAKHVVNFPFIKQTYETFGKRADGDGPGIFHGRTSTNADGLINTHPMQQDGWNLIHNGVVEDHGPEYEMTTDNDSEHVLYRLIQGIEQVETHLEGYYAFASIDPKGRLHIARDCYATLFMAYSETYDSLIIATTESLLLKLNKMLEAKLGPIDEIEDDVYIIFQGNEVVHYQSIKPRGYTSKQAVHAEASLGRTIVDGQSDQVAAYQREAVSEADWIKSDAEWNTFIEGVENDTNDRSERTEFEYYRYRLELDNMDAAYKIYDENDNVIPLHEFRRMDHISQELCRIVRPDGTMLDLDSRDPRLKYG